MNCARYFITYPLRSNGRLSTPIIKSLFSSKPPVQKIVKEIDINTGELITKKSTIIPKITLITSNDDSIQITTLEEAEKLAKRRDLKLIKIIDLDTKTNRPIYKLMSGTEYYLEDLKQREQKKKEKQHSNQYIKGEKLLLLNSRIAQHDLQTQIKKCLKWIDKMYEIRVVINGDAENSEKVYKAFEEQFKGNDAKFVQKRYKGNDLKFQILPPKKKDDNNQI